MKLFTEVVIKLKGSVFGLIIGYKGRGIVGNWFVEVL